MRDLRSKRGTNEPLATKLVGGCHCGAIRLALTLSRRPHETPVRACDCTFCRAHGARTVSDPAGQVALTLRAPDGTHRYRFGLRTADFLVCRECGVYVAAVANTERGLKATVNINALDEHALFQRMAAAVSYGAETAEGRLARRAANWTPAIIRVLSQSE